MLKYVLLVVFFMCFTWHNLQAESDSEISNSDLIFPNISIQALDEPNYRAFPAQQNEKMFVVLAYSQANWFKAQEICGYQGLSLASINSKAENDALLSYLTQTGLNANDEYFWTAGSRLADNNRWVWFNTGRPISYFNWHVGEPNNAAGQENCISLSSDGRWHDWGCTGELYFICETRCPLTSYDSPIFTRK
ncbi:perlucin-like [Anastrepha obliqua]|uniref:perlucin-like n=1 Tax=Anastrepha obliqua TaxID=95512 RepID=UPI00240A60AA|nr:perlucin-like [Anastrepha obliqua]